MCVLCNNGRKVGGVRATPYQAQNQAEFQQDASIEFLFFGFVLIVLYSRLQHRPGLSASNLTKLSLSAKHLSKSFLWRSENELVIEFFTVFFF